MLGANTWAGLPNSVRVLGSAAFSIPFSLLMARVGRRRGLVLGYAVGTAGAAISVLSAAWMSFPLLILGSALFGAGYASNLLSRYAAADVSAAADRGKAISFAVWGGTVGAILGPSVIGPAGSLAASLGLSGIAGAFGVSTVAFVVAATVIFLFLRPDPLEVARVVAERDTLVSSPAQPRPLRQLLQLPGVQLALLTLICANIVMIGIMAMTPVYMHDHGHSLSLVGLVISAHVVGMYVFSPATGWLADRIGRTPVIALSAATFVTAALINSFSPPEWGWLLGFGMFLIGLGWNLGFVTGSALLTDSVEVLERPRLQGLADSGMGVAAAVGSLASGSIMEGHGFGALNFVIAVLVVFPLMAILFPRFRQLPSPA
jgi:MFS family permease